MVLTVFLVSIIAFVIMQLPPGDYLTTYIVNLEAQGTYVSDSIVEALELRYGLGQPMHIQYFRWITSIFKGDFGVSFQYDRPVLELILERIFFTFVLAFLSLIFTWVIAFPIGIYSAINQYSLGDYFFTIIGFIGRAIPNFMLALILMWFSYSKFGVATWGLFSDQYIEAPWSIYKFLDLFKHLWIPVIIIGTAGAAGLIRIMRANLLDELKLPYVTTAKSKGLPDWKVIWKYPVRVAVNPFISTLGWQIPRLISGSTITSVVLSLPTAGPLFLRALQAQDMYLAGAFVFILSVLTVIGTFLSDILLSITDPRIRYA